MIVRPLANLSQVGKRVSFAWRLGLIALALESGCAALLGADFDRPGETPTPSVAGTEGDGGTTLVPPDEVPPPERLKPDGTCNEGRKRCGDQCVSKLDARFGCGAVSCDACTGVPACTRSGTCAPASCIPDHEDSPMNCGPSCKVCTAPANAAPTCNQGTCGFTCEADSILRDGRCVGEQVWMVGTGGTILRWNGRAWSVQPSGTTMKLTSIWGANRSDIWAAGFGGGASAPNILHYDGKNWSVAQFGLSTQFEAIWGSGPADVWAGGSGTPSLLRRTGTTWSPMPNPLVVVTTIWGTSADDVWIGGRVSNGSFRVAHWNGAWSSTMSVGGGDNNTNLAGSSATDVWNATACPGPSICAYHWNGTLWSEKSPSFTGGAPGAIWGQSGTDYWMVNNRCVGTGCNGRKSDLLHWNGSVWSSAVAQTDGSLQAMWGRSSSDVWAAGEGGVVAHWNGNQWTVGTGPAPADLNAIWGE